MRLKILVVAIVSMAAASCVFHHEVKSAPEHDRMEFAAGAKAAHADPAKRHD